MWPSRGAVRGNRPSIPVLVEYSDSLADANFSIPLIDKRLAVTERRRMTGVYNETIMPRYIDMGARFIGSG